jgi:hypothetical protein
LQGWYSTVDSTEPGGPASQSPSYPLHGRPHSSGKL